MIYTKLIKPILFRFDPEHVHDAFVALGEKLGNFGVGRRVLSAVYGYRGRDISKTVDGIRYKTPVLLSAGFDYNARLTRILPSFSFGGVEVGSVTARPCTGNPRPRLTRLPRSQSIIVNKGLRNEGADRILKRIAARKREQDFVIGISIARTNDEQAAAVDEGIRDYVTTLQKFTKAGVGDYYTLNISCPNAFCGETFADPALLPLLLKEIAAAPCRKPIYIKMPISISWDDFAELLSIADRYGISGVVIGNLNKNYGALDFPEEAPKKYKGGLSGKPCFNPSNELIQKTRGRFGERFTIIGCGGILSPEDAMAKFNAGADLIQLITGMIFYGPSLISRICEAYVLRIHEKAVE